MFYDEFQDSDDLTVAYHNAKWAEGEVWRFARDKTLEDSDAIARLAKKIGEDKPAAGLEAFLSRMSRSWSVKVPASFKGKDGKLHPLAGETPPLTLEWIRKLGEGTLLDAFQFLLKEYGGRSAEEEDSFRGADQPAPEGPKADA